MRIDPLHSWDLSSAEAIALQRELAARVIRTGDVPESAVHVIAGADVAFDKPNGRAVGAIVLLAWPSLDVLYRVTIETAVTFPYVPGLLSFREAPVLLEAFERLDTRPDLLFIDGHGYAHPRRFGFACHVGLLLDVPAIGIAKSRLIGEQGTVRGPRGSRADLTDGGEVIGSMLRTRQGVRSVYVSVGHRVGLSTAERWALACARGYRVPEPTRLADRLAGEAKRRMIAATVEVVIEQRPGDTVRWEWSDGIFTWQGACAPFPAAYGCVEGIVNPGDNELLDVVVAGPGDYARGDRITVRIIDVLTRADGDDKFLGVPIGLPPAQVGDIRERFFRWMVERERPVIEWAGEETALRMLAEMRAGTAP